MILLEFAIERTVIRRLEVEEEAFEKAIHHITPTHLRETGLPFEDKVLHTKQYVLDLWKYFFIWDDPESLAYTGRFVDSLTVTNTNYTTAYKITPRGTKRSSESTDSNTKKIRHQ
jgi:hypothetical protein